MAVVAIAAIFLTPILYVAWRTTTLDADLSELIGEVRGPLWRTVQLALLVSVCTGVLGTAMAWLIVRTDLPGASLWRVLAPLPLVFPSFIGAAAFLAGLGPDGVIRSALEVIGYHPPRRFRGLGASTLVLTLFTYPYVYLPVAARLQALPPSIEESARMLGDPPIRFFVRIVVPAIKQSVLGGMIIVLLYGLSEFGAVQLLGFDTLTRVLYATRLADRALSFACAALLVALALVAVTIERRAGGSLTVAPTAGGRVNRPIRLRRWRIPALGAVVLTLLFALVAPTVALAQWAWRGIAREDAPLRALGEELAELRGPAWTTTWLGVSAAILAVVAVLPVAMLSARYRARIAPVANASVIAGFAVPGLVIALGLAFWSLNIPMFNRFYQTVPLLLTAYVVHFGSQALRSAETSVAAVPRRAHESARLLGATPLRRALTIDGPLIRPGALAGGGLVMLSTVKELPATLLLAPIGYETLTTRVWSSFEEGFLAEAGLASLVLLAVSGLLTWLLVLRRLNRQG